MALSERSAQGIGQSLAGREADGAGSEIGSGNPRATFTRTVRARILLADGHSELLGNVRRLLEQIYEVEVVTDGPTALERVRISKPDLVVTDVIMSGVDGFGLLRGMRSDPGTAAIPVIVVSAGAGEGMRVESAGADEYLVEPFSAQELLARISARLEIARIQREARAEAMEIEERRRLAMDAAGMGSWDWNRLTGHITWSASARKLFGVGDDTPISFVYLESLIHSADRASNRLAIKRSLATGDYEHEYRIVRPDGAVRWISARGRIVRDERGRPTRMIGVVHDCTERQLREQALRESERQLSILLSNLPGMAYRCLNDENSTVVFMSAGVAGITGYDAAEFTSGRMHWADLGHPDDVALVWEAVQNGIRERRPFQMEYRIRHRDGTVRWVWEQGEGVFDTSGELVALEGFVADITQRRTMEEALREADRRKDDFLAMLGHELRNPLAAISSGIALLRMDPPADRREWAEQMVERQARQLQRLVDDLLDVTRITRGKIRLHKKALDVRTVVESAVQSIGGVFEDRGHDLIVALPDEPIMVVADAARLEQVIVNLLTNAAKYTPQGGTVKLEAEESGMEAVIRCTDTGIGIAADMLDAVFESFVQIEPGLDRTASGLGMGLTLVKRLTEMHGGHVSASSAGKGKGSEFTICIPTQRASQPAVEDVAGEEVPDEIASDAMMRVLVIDDNRDLAESVATYLRGTGHHVVVAYDGESGIACAERNPPDVILLDLGLPGIDGFDVASRLRRTPSLKDAAVIAISGYTPQEERVREVGFDAHLVKPVSYGRLMRTLRETLAARR